MGWEHEPDTVWRAQELYCVDRLSFARVAELTGVSASTLKVWAEKYGWRSKRESLAQAESDIRVNTIMGRKLALEMLLRSGDAKEASQMAFAVASLEGQAMKQAELAAAGKIPTFFDSASRPHIATRADAVAALRQAMEGKIGMALADPAKINAATIKDISQCLELLGDLEASLPKTEAPDEAKGKAISAENTQKLREILGV